MGGSSLVISQGCREGKSVCEIEIPEVAGYAIELNGQPCPREASDYRCPDQFLPTDNSPRIIYLPGPRQGRLTVFKDRKQVEGLQVYLPASRPQDPNKWTSILIDRALDEALALEEPRSDEALTDIAQILAQNGYLQEAQQVFDSIRSPANRAVVLASIATHNKDLNRLREARELASSIEQKNQRDMALGKVSKAFADSGNFENALSTANDIGSPYVKSDALRDIVHAMANENLFSEALAAVELIESSNRKAEALVSIVTRLAEGGRYREAIRLAKKIEHPRPRSVALAKIARVSRNSRLFDDSAALAFKVFDPVQRLEALREIGLLMIEAGFSKKGTAIARSIGRRYSSALILGALARARRDVSLFGKALSLAESVSEPRFRSEIPNFVCALPPEREVVQKSDTLRQIAIWLADSARVGWAVKIAMSISDPIVRIRTLVEIATRI